MALQLHVKVFLENIQPPFEFIFSGFFTLSHDGLRHQGTKAASCCNQPLMVFMYQFLVDSGVLAVHPFDISEGGEFNEIFVTSIILCQKNLMVSGVFFFFRKGLSMSVFSDVKFATHDGFYFQWTIFVFRIFFVFMRFCNKLKNTEHVAVI